MSYSRNVDVLFIGYDANRTGGALMLLNFLRWFKENTNWKFAVLLQHGGALLPEYRGLSETHVLTGDFTQFGRLGPYLEPLRGTWRMATAIQKMRIPFVARRLSPRLIYVNSSAAGSLLQLLSGVPAPVISHIHELETLRVLLPDGHDFPEVISRTEEYIVVSNAVKQDLKKFHNIPDQIMTVIHGFIDPLRFCVSDDSCEAARRQIREKLGIPLNAFVVAGIGALNWTKAPDVLLQVARVVEKQKPDQSIRFIWMGYSAEPGVVPRISHDLQRLGLKSTFQLVPGQVDVVPYFLAIDVLALTSREDAFPLVVLEAAAAGKPTICFADAGGAPEFVGTDCGVIEPYLNIEAMADCIVQLSENPDFPAALGSNARSKVKLRHRLENIAPKVLEIMEKYLS